MGNPEIPIETFDMIVTDEAHRSIYNLWRQALKYVDAYLIGLTATPSKQTFGFFNRILVMEYGHEQAVADGVNVNYDVYRIRTQVSEAGGRGESGYYVDLRDKLTRKVRWEQLDEEFAYDPNQLDRAVVALDQIRTLVRTFRDKLPTEIFPGRPEVPKTLVFAKDDSHAEDIVRIVREEFGKGRPFTGRPAASRCSCAGWPGGSGAEAAPHLHRCTALPAQLPPGQRPIGVHLWRPRARVHRAPAASHHGLWQGDLVLCGHFGEHRARLPE